MNMNYGVWRVIRMGNNRKINGLSVRVSIAMYNPDELCKDVYGSKEASKGESIQRDGMLKKLHGWKD
ncbi:hypothetical protein GOBAR_DD12391 [Gossypium barbadense]|nr:hypothetical protein GOBAR_DD12391 [Gossypium barbadense]